MPEHSTPFSDKKRNILERRQITPEELTALIFAKNKDLPRSSYRGYTQRQRQYLLASLVPVVYSPAPPLYDEQFKLLDEIIVEREREVASKPIVVEGGDDDDQIIVSE